MRRIIWPVLFLGCTTGGHTPYTNPSGLVPVDVPAGRIYRYPPAVKEAISPVPYGDWFVSSKWIEGLAAKWSDLPGAFEPEGPEYCSSIDVDTNRMVHARMPVRAIRDVDSRIGCPPVAGSPGNKAVGSAHQHQILQSKGERISADDAALGSPFLLADTIKVAYVVVDFDAPGDCLQGINPATGKPAPVPSQSFLFTKVDGKIRVFMWTPLRLQAEGKERFVKVYRPNGMDGWEEAGTCWVVTAEREQAEFRKSVAAVHCNPDDFWLKE